MSKATKCDRCKKFFDGSGDEITYRDGSSGWSDIRKELCDSCKEALLRFMNMGKKVIK